MILIRVLYSFLFIIFMSKSSFASLIISHLNSQVGSIGSSYNSSTPSISSLAVSSAVTEYLVGNVKISISYTGTDSSGKPDVVSDSVGVIGNVAPPIGTTLKDWLGSLESNIVSGLMISSSPGLVVPISPTPAFRPGLIVPDLYSMIGDSNKSAQKIAWEGICSSILVWLNSIIPPTYPATHLNSTGVAVCGKVAVE